MTTTYKYLLTATFCFAVFLSTAQNNMSKELYRPLIHFTPKAHWINDPNGMVYHKGLYHLFFQYYPDSTVWGPMHWGHATSKDLLHWDEQPIGLYPDSLGYIFSGSAVIDKNNSSGFGKNGVAPMVAIFTQHDPVGEKSGSTVFQNQSIAYSLDDGKTWVKYAGNPVIKNPGIIDFRDPKVMWYEAQKKWVMTLATKDRVTFYSSPNLKEWNKESEFGATLGAHGGVWECPDLFPLDDNGKQVWVLLVSINPGAPNKGSGTQYFTGDFDGHQFTPHSTDTKWIDYGTDNYAGITWSNTGNRKIFIGWMNNWQYANLVPTKAWRGAMTLPRELKLKHVGKEVFLASEPVKELSSLQSVATVFNKLKLKTTDAEAGKTIRAKFPCRLNLSVDEAVDFSVVCENTIGERIMFSYEKASNQFVLDRTRSGVTNFEKGFAAKHTAPRIGTSKTMQLSLIIDVASIEVFADDGLTVMTDVFFPYEPYQFIEVVTSKDATIEKLEYIPLKRTLKN